MLHRQIINTDQALDYINIKTLGIKLEVVRILYRDALLLIIVIPPGPRAPPAGLLSMPEECLSIFIIIVVVWINMQGLL